jgi:Asp-tRNA(Asn)/Glu-tRNA(Gln) amidotransferase B subunit
VGHQLLQILQQQLVVVAAEVIVVEVAAALAEEQGKHMVAVLELLDKEIAAVAVAVAQG